MKLKYKQLKIGDKILKGDEYLFRSYEAWQEIGLESIGKIIGVTWLPCRRPIRKLRIG